MAEGNAHVSVDKLERAGYGAAGFVQNTTLGPSLGLPLNPQAAAEAQKLLSYSLSKIESFWLKGNGRFLLGSFQPSIAELSLVCETMQLEFIFSTATDGKIKAWLYDNMGSRVDYDALHRKTNLVAKRLLEGIRRLAMSIPMWPCNFN